MEAKKHSDDSKSYHKLVLTIFFAAIIGFQISINPDLVSPTLWEIPVIPVGDDSYYDVATLLYMSGSLITAIAAIVVSKKYLGSAMFTKAYFFLALGFSFWFVGDFLYFYDAYVTALPGVNIPYTLNPDDGTFELKVADFVYLGIYPCMTLHLYLNTNYFDKRKKFKEKSYVTKFFLFGIPIIGTIIFFVQFGSITFESGFGALNVVGASVTLGLVFWGARVFRKSALAPAWTLLLLGIFFSTVGDFLYYQVESFNDEYVIYSLSTTFYLLTYMILTYGLYKHVRIL